MLKILVHIICGLIVIALFAYMINRDMQDEP